MSDIPLKSATIVCAVHKESALAGCAVCDTLDTLLKEAYKYKEIREKLMSQLVVYLQERKATLTWIK